MNHKPFSRDRRNLLLAGTLGLLFPATLWARRLTPTPHQTAGPFYPQELPVDDDADLTWVENRSAPARGEPTDLSGRILDLNGAPLAETRIEIWQCDASGYYRHRLDRGGDKVDPNFQGHGHTESDASGTYRFRTIKPVAYPGRTPHIHMAVFPRGEKPFVTQLYIAGDERNQSDFLYRSVPTEKRHLVQAAFTPTGGPQPGYSVTFNLILGGADRTPA